MLQFIAQKDTDKYQQRKRYIGWSPGETRHRLPAALSQWSYMDKSPFAQYHVWQDIQSVTNQDSSSSLGSRFMLGLRLTELWKAWKTDLNYEVSSIPRGQSDTAQYEPQANNNNNKPGIHQKSHC